MADSSPYLRERQIFEHALDLESAGERLGYVKGACADDAALLARVQALLQAHDESSRFLPDDPSGAATVLFPTTEQAGAVIGRYKLLEKIGEGGFGAVYVAEQREPVKRRVALKIIKLGMDTRQVVARFEAERQALALMDHPNIAKIFDAGVTEAPVLDPDRSQSGVSAGRPYFVMELVRGIPITQYCDENHLSAGDRLKLFILVCHAIQHAHQKGIIHRDIKPSNVLVTVNDGVAVPKVIDFGIAKATQGELTDKTVYTQFQQFIGTPAYMSPEQAFMTSLDVDTRSDIYALGVLLYELLVGKTPFDAKELLLSGLDEMRRTIREKEPIRPSTRLQSLVGEERTAASKRRGADMARLTAILRGDVDWIVMKCLEKDRTRRYETANGLAADIKRFLNQEPIVARPPTVTYRLGKMVKRNKLAFAAVSAVTLTLIGGLGLSIWAFRGEAAQRRTAVEQQEKAEAAQHNEAIQHQLADAQRDVAVALRKLADMQVALQAWEEGDLQRANDLIAASRPAPGQAPGFEWRYLRKLCQDQSFEPFGRLDRSYRSASFIDGDVLLLNDERTLTLRDRSQRNDQLLLGDEDGISNPTFGPGDTNLLATVTDAGRIKVWDLAARRVRVEFEGHPGSKIKALAFSRGGKWLASAGGLEDGSLKLWDVEAANPAPARILHHYSYEADGVLFSPDGTRLFSSGSDRMIRAWDAVTGAESAVPLAGHTGWVGPLAASPDGRLMASGAGDCAVILWNVPSHTPDARLLGHIAAVHALAFSPDGRTLASAGEDRTVRLWDLGSRQQRALLRGHVAKVVSLSFSPDGQVLVSRSEDGLVKLWHAATDPEGNALVGSPEWLQDVALSPDGRFLASVATDSFAVNLWDLHSRKRSLLDGHTHTVMSAAFSPDGSVLATGSHDRTVRLWDVTTHKTVATLTNEFPVGSTAFSPDGRTLIVGGSSWYMIEKGQRAGLQFWDIRSQKPTGTVAGAASDIVELALSASGSLLATGHAEGDVSLWDAETRQLVHRFESPFKSQVISLAFSPTEPLLAASDMGGNIVFYNTSTRTALPSMKAHTFRVMSLAFSPDGRSLASAGEAGGLKLWNVATRQVALTLKGHAGTVTGVVFSREGNFMASCGADATVRLWPAARIDEVAEVTSPRETHP